MKISTVRLPLILSAVFCLVFAQGCGDEDPTQPGEPNPQINGSVVKSDGKPLDSAEVVLLFHTGPGSGVTTGAPFVSPNPANTVAHLRFSVAEPNTFVTARVLDPLLGVTAAAPLNFVASAGEYNYPWDLKEHSDSARTIRNGWYHVRMEIGGQAKTTPLLITSENSVPFATTDSLGKFFIDYRLIPRDSTANQTDAEGNVLGRFSVVDTVTVLVRKAGYTTQRKTIGIDRSQSASIKFTF